MSQTRPERTEEWTWRARLLVALRVPIVVGWLAAAAAAVLFLPSLEEADSASLGGLVAADAGAVAAEERSLELFRVPLLSRTVVVQRDPDGLSAAAQARVAARAQAINERRDPLLQTIVFALPIANTAGLFPGSRERTTTAITYLYFEPTASLYARAALAQTYAGRIEAARDPLTGVGGAVPARLAQWDAITGALPRVELLTVLFLFLLLGGTFRSFAAPLVALGAAGIAFVVSSRLVAWTGTTFGVTVPREVEPVLLVLLLGVVTDYAIFFIAGFRRDRAEGRDRLDAVRAAVTANTGVVATAGLIVALGSAALIVGRLQFFRALGPAAGLTVLLSLLVCLTFVPAALALFGERMFRRPRPGAASPAAGPRRRRTARILTSRPVAAVGVAVTVAALALAAVPALDLRLGFTLIRGLPADDAVQVASNEAALGFAKGILSPTLVVLEGEGLRRPPLARLQELLEAQPGVAGVVGPRNLPDRIGLDVFVAPDGRAARFALILEQEPLSAPAIEHLRRLERSMPRLLSAAGITGARASFAGDTAIASETIEEIVGDTTRIAIAALLVNAVLLALFLRALLAPLYLLASSALALAAALGATGYVFMDRLGHADVTYYVPFAAAVLLLSLGSDYNVFVVGRIWAEARRSSVRDAVSYAVPRASNVVSVAALALAGSFAALALVPLQPFRELAFAMSVGILIDAFVVRTVLVPALVLLFGERSWWPARRPTPPPSETPTPAGPG